MSTLAPLLRQKFFNSNTNLPLAGGKVYSYAAGTTTPIATYQDEALTILNTNPVILDANGEADIHLSAPTKINVLDASNNQIPGYPIDSITTTEQLISAVYLALANTSNTALGVSLIGGAGRVVDSIASLRAVLKTSNSRVFATGYYSPGDGGGGPYWYDPSDTTSADNGGTIIVGADGGRWKLVFTNVLTVKQFGAKGDGATDDTVYLQAAINFVSISTGSDYWEANYRRLLLPSGVYVHGGLVWSVPIDLIGDGQLATTLALKNNANTHAITINVPTVATNDTFRQSGSITGMSIDCNGSSQTGTCHGIYLPDSPNNINTRYDGSVFLEDVMVRAAKNANIFVGVNRNNGGISNAVSVYAGTDCLTMYSYDWRLSDSDFGNSTSNGLNMIAGGALAANGCNFYTNTNVGAAIQSFVNAPCSFIDCYFDTNGTNGFYAEGTNLDNVYHMVSNSTFRDNGATTNNTFAHIRLVNLQNASLLGNSFIVNNQTIRASYLLQITGTPSVIFGGMADTINAITKPYATAICNAPANILDPSYLNGAWISYAPVVTAATGTITTAAATGSYKKVGKTIYFQAQIIITTNGTGATYVNITLPFAVATGANYYGNGRNATAGGALIVEGTSGGVNCAIRKYDDTYPGANATTLNVSGVYQAA